MFVLLLALLGSLTGFLFFNFNPAKVFMGDGGSMFIGFMVGAGSVVCQAKSATLAGIAMPALALGVPIFDTVLTMIRRPVLDRRSIFSGERGHIHHRLLDRGLSQWQALCVIGAFCLATGAAAHLAVVGNDALAVLAVAALLALMIRLRLFGYHELALVQRAVAGMLAGLARQLGTSARRRLPDAGQLAQLDFDRAWRLLVDEAKTWNVQSVEFTLSHEGEYLRRHDWTDPVGQAGQAEEAADARAL